MKMKVSGKISELSSCSIRYLELRTYHSARPDWCPSVASSSFLSQRLNASRNLYSKDLYAHYGCVNAIEFSNEGDLLVSGGDDRRVLLWNVDGALSGSHSPRIMKGEHNSNIFCLSFDSSNTRIFSAGNDEQVIVHDLKTGETLDVFLHREAVYGVSVSPTSDSVFASAGEDGRVLLYDMREPAATDPVCLAAYYDAFHAVQFHPVEPLLVTANSRKGVSLWDIRQPRIPVIRYGEKHCAQASICARFNRNGSQIIALRRRLPPVLYDTHSSKPVCQFDAEHYYNSCTMKSCCFAGDNDQFVLSGSDDFNLYMWKIPESNSGKNFVSEAHMVLKGHRSIVNEVRFNPQNFIIASSGVEKIVKLWSGLSLPGSKGNLRTNSSGNFMTRRVYTHDEYIGLVMESGQDVNHDYSHGSMDEDPRMMAFFDSLVQREVEGWTSNTDLSDDIDNDAQGSGNDDDTETTTTTTQSSFSRATSQSDDNDSDDETNGGPGQESSDEQQATRQKLNQLQRQHTNNGSPKNDNDDDDDDEDEERDKASGGSEWIMHLIAKKRAKLRIAKRAKRKRKHLRRHHKKTQHLLRSFTTQRRYLYHPEGQNSSEERPLQRELPGAVTESGGTFRQRMSYRRRYMAPYTIMVVHNTEQDSEPESDEQENANASDTENNHTTEQQTRDDSDKVDNAKRLLWSSDSESSTDSGLCPPKRKRTTLSDSDSDVNDQMERSNGHIISEIIDSSDSETEKSVVETTEVQPRNMNSEGSSSTSSCLPNILNDNTLSEDSFGDSNGMCDINSELSISTASNAIPISSISCDENGSLLFETENHSLVSGIDLPSTIDIPTTNAARKFMQNGSNQSINGTFLENTHDCVNIDFSNENEKNENSPNRQNTEDNVANNSENSSTRGQSFKFKKRMSALNVRNYRRHSEDDL